MTDHEGGAEMDPQACEELLRRGGFDLGALPADAEVRQASLPRYNALRDPAGGERLGRELAALLDQVAVDTVMIWQEATDVALGFVVARQLKVPAVRCYDYEGLVAFDGEFGTGRRAAIVSDVPRDAESVRAMLALAEQQARSVVAAALLVEIETPGVAELRAHGVSTLALVSTTASA